MHSLYSSRSWRQHHICKNMQLNSLWEKNWCLGVWLSCIHEVFISNFCINTICRRTKRAQGWRRGKGGSAEGFRIYCTVVWPWPSSSHGTLCNPLDLQHLDLSHGRNHRRPIDQTLLAASKISFVQFGPAFQFSILPPPPLSCDTVQRQAYVSHRGKIWLAQLHPSPDQPRR